MSAATPTFAENPSQPAAVPGFWARFRGMITRPTATMAGLTEPDAWFWPSIMLLVGYTIFYLPIGVGLGRLGVSVMAQTMGMSRTSAQDPQAASALAFMRNAMPMAYIFSAMLQVPFTVALSWATRSGLFYGLARLMGGSKPSWARVVAMVGWAWVPLFIQYVLVGVAMLLYPKLFSLLMYMPDLKHPVPTQAALGPRWVMLGLRELSPLVLWNLYLCTLGVERLFELPRWKAALVVLLPMVAYALFEVGSILLAASMSQMFGGMGPVTPGR